MVDANPPGTRYSDTHYYQEYNEYATTLRTWLVAYGIGGPVLYLTQQNLPPEIQTSPHAARIALLFLAGVVIQVGSALLYKAAAWRLHYTQELITPRQQKPPWAEWVEKHYWIDIATDGLTIILFAWATRWVFLILK
jgi:hypothetical protein